MLIRPVFIIDMVNIRSLIFLVFDLNLPGKQTT